MDAYVTISRWTSGRDTGIRIDIEEKKSGVKIVSLDMEPKAFAEAVTGLGYQDATVVDWAGKDASLVGKELESKTVKLQVDRISGRQKTKELILNSEVLKEYYKEGWVLFDDGMQSQQNEYGVHKVILRRWV